MNAITRNTNNSKRGKHLLFPFNGNMYVSLKNAKILCGYSETTGNDVILNKVSESNIVKLLSFSKKGNISETYYLNYNGFVELEKNLTQKDKKQNAKLALEMMQSAIIEIRDYQSLNKVKNEPTEYDYMYRRKLANEIVSMLGKYNEDTKADWIELYDELDRHLNESIRHTHQRYIKNTGSKISLLNFIVNCTNLTEKLYEIAYNLYKK